MDPITLQEHFIGVDQFILFGTMMNYYLINPNQVKEFKTPFRDNPFDAKDFGIEAYEVFIPFTYKQTVISFELRVSTEWEEQNLP